MPEESRKNERTEAMGTAANKMDRKPMEEITIKFAKGLVGEPFTNRDGKELVRISIPNSDPKDHTPWQEFVLASKQVHENQYGKGMWAKIPAEGHTTVSKPFLAGQDENGRNIWKKEMRSVSNRELKEMVEFYKNRGRDAGTPSSPDRQAQNENAREDSSPQKEQMEPSNPVGDKAPPRKKQSLRDQLKTGKKEADKANISKEKPIKKLNKEPEL